MSEKFMFGFFWVHCNGDSSKTKFLFLNIFSWSFYVDLKKGEKRNAKNYNNLWWSYKCLCSQI
ncbi:MAG TPA: hypothetical protein PKC94_23315, partial [Leptospiraceae bacterium]|nr:hypothetical protein [Leptospiraceae bacterium]